MCSPSGAASSRRSADPPIRTLEEPDPRVDLDLVREGLREGDRTASPADSFGFGGHDVSPVRTR
ncbi:MULTISPECIES: hypothetical protein [Streptomyces]|uniref:Uncharacterized protein n=1 Tax=Streptomyces changanensis TaxID=2964669 RepID=A0ABY5NDC5_9ACTN|nr:MULTISPECIES: hypothetical protein [Streptomyces]UUS34048.1 hypothetical protein NRO40_26640 [Streptomyces changanensis]